MIFFFIFVRCLLDSVLIAWEEILFRSLVELKGLKESGSYGFFFLNYTSILYKNGREKHEFSCLWGTWYLWRHHAIQPLRTMLDSISGSYAISSDYFVSLLFSSDRLGLYQMGLSKTMFMTFAWGLLMVFLEAQYRQQHVILMT